MRTQFALLLLVVAIAAAGCSGGATNRDPVYKVRGKVTYLGKPVAAADLTFNNDEMKRSAFGRTNDNGEYELTTFSANDGAVAGKHSVTIIQVPVPPTTPTLPETDSADYAPPEFNVSTDPVRPKTTLPEKYATPATSGLIAVVNEDGENVIDFDLKD